MHIISILGLVFFLLHLLSFRTGLIGITYLLTLHRPGIAVMITVYYISIAVY